MNENQKIVIEYLKEEPTFPRFFRLVKDVPQVPQHVREAHAKLSEEEREQAYMAGASEGNNIYWHIITDISNQNIVLENLEEVITVHDKIEDNLLNEIEVKTFHLLEDDLTEIKESVKTGWLFNQIVIIYTPNLEEVDYLDEDIKNSLNAYCVKISKQHN